MAKYSKGRIIGPDGNELIQVQEFTLETRGNHGEVRTLALGRAGNVTGSPDSTISFTNAVPADGFEKHFMALVLSGEEVKLTIIVAGGVQIAVTGWFESETLKASEGNADSYDVTFQGGPPEIS